MNRHYRSTGANWIDVAAKASTEPWARATVDALAGAFDGMERGWPGDPPTELSAWTHHYYCDADATRLSFDFAKPNQHACEHCGRVYTGEPWDGAWRTQLHGTIVGAVERAAILARLRPQNPCYAAFVRRIALFYAEHYHDYPEHGSHAGKGKIMPQCLDESILLISLGRYLQWGGGQNWLNPDEVRLVRDRLFAPAVELPRAQVSKNHNIHAWMMSALATCAQQPDDRALLDWTIESEFGFLNQLAKGTNADGFWFEGSLTYHFYTFNVLMSHALTAGEMGATDLFDAPKFQDMMSAPLGLVYPSGEFPAHNDCWPGIKLSPALYELSAWAWPDASFARDLDQITRRSPVSNEVACWTATVDRVSTKPTGFPRSSVHALLWGPTHVTDDAQAPRLRSRHFSASGVAILENDNGVRVCLRSGPHGGMHDHRDKLNIDVFAAGQIVSPDLGTSGYAARITGAWYKTAASHNTVVVNRQRQNACDGEIIEFDPSRVVGRTVDAYAGVKLVRTITLRPDGWQDVFDVTSDREVQIDPFFHAVGAVSTSIQTSEGATLGQGSGYDWPRHVRRGSTDSAWTATWTGAQGTLVASFGAVPGTQVFTSEADTNPAGGALGVLTVRRLATSTRFVVDYVYTPAVPEETRP